VPIAQMTEDERVGASLLTHYPGMGRYARSGGSPKAPAHNPQSVTQKHFISS
jgi:hypothetical protein